MSYNLDSRDQDREELTKSGEDDYRTLNKDLNDVLGLHEVR